MRFFELSLFLTVMKYVFGKNCIYNNKKFHLVSCFPLLKTVTKDHQKQKLINV